VRTLENLKAIPTGFDRDHIALLSADPEAVQYEPARILQYVRAAEARLAAVPGVRGAAYGRVIPIGFGGSRETIFVPAYQPHADEDMEINFNVVSPHYFAATDIALLDGRAFSDADGADRPLVAVVNETMARRYWPNSRAVGQQFRLGSRGPALEVLGIARDVKYRELRETAGPSFYVPIAQAERPRGGVFHVRTAGDPAALLETLRRALIDVDPAVPIASVRTLREQVDLNVNDDRLAMTIGTALGGAALLLAAVGLFGAMSYAVGRRTREIGVRLALGATPRDVGRLVLGEGLRLAVVGSMAGIAMAFWIGHLIRNRLYGVTPADPLSFLAAVALLCAVALCASWIPARLATQVDPAQALRLE
jgi:predicted permease